MSHCIDALGRHGADVDKAKPVRLCQTPVRDPTERQLHRGQDPTDGSMSLTSIDGCNGEQGGWTPIIVAAQNGHEKCIIALGRYGSDVNMAMPVREEHAAQHGVP